MDLLEMSDVIHQALLLHIGRKIRSFLEQVPAFFECWEIFNIPTL